MPKNKTVIATDFYRNPVEVKLSDLRWRPAAYAIVIKDNKILLSQQINGYDLPGGGIDFGETPEEAVIREIKEETGINASNPRLIDAGTAFFKSWSKAEIYYQGIVLYYRCDFVGGKLSSTGLEDHEREFTDGPVWLELNKLDNIEMGSYREFRDIVKKVLKNENNRH